MQEKHLDHLPRKSSKLDVAIEDIAHELGLNGDDRLIDSILDPCAVVILGASGDLAGRKLLPSLFRLYLEGRLPEPFTIVGSSRTKWDHEKFKVMASEKDAIEDLAGMYQEDMGGRSTVVSEVRRADEDHQFYNRGVGNTADPCVS